MINENQALINNILERKNYLKRPKVSNITQVIFVVSPKMPNINFLMLDKQLCYAEFLGIKPIIVINKTDLNQKETDNIFEIYTSSGYKVIKSKAEIGEGINEIKDILQDNITVLSGQSGVRKIYNYKSNAWKKRSKDRRNKQKE